jgi:hypothetical protein
MVCCATRRGRDPSPSKIASLREGFRAAWNQRAVNPPSPNPSAAAGKGARGSAVPGAGCNQEFDYFRQESSASMEQDREPALAPGPAARAGAEAHACGSSGLPCALAPQPLRAAWFPGGLSWASLPQPRCLACSSVV